MNKDLSHVPCVGSELTHPIDGRLYGQSTKGKLTSPSAAPDGQHEVCGTEPNEIPNALTWLTELAHSKGR
jgi:hypothetical protein